MTFYSFQVMNKVSVNTSGFRKQRAVVTCEISLTNSFYICLSENRSQIPLIPFVPSTDASIINSYWEKSCALNADS